MSWSRTNRTALALVFSSNRLFGIAPSSFPQWEVRMNPGLVHDRGRRILLGQEPIPLSQPFADMLYRHLATRPNLRTAEGVAPSPWLFPACCAAVTSLRRASRRDCAAWASTCSERATPRCRASPQKSHHPLWQSGWATAITSSNATPRSQHNRGPGKGAVRRSIGRPADEGRCLPKLN
jgi:hypothetical protein